MLDNSGHRPQCWIDTLYSPDDQVHLAMVNTFRCLASSGPYVYEGERFYYNQTKTQIWIIYNYYIISNLYHSYSQYI